jgi:hypothetical protein
LQTASESILQGVILNVGILESEESLLRPDGITATLLQLVLIYVSVVFEIYIAALT